MWRGGPLRTTPCVALQQQKMPQPQKKLRQKNYLLVRVVWNRFQGFGIRVMTYVKQAILAHSGQGIGELQKDESFYTITFL